MVQALSNWCYQTDPPDSARIARVLEVAKDLKVIMSMVNTDQFPFVIELAAFAAKRDFLNLDKWTTDKMKAHQVSTYLCTINYHVPKLAPLFFWTRLMMEIILP